MTRNALPSKSFVRSFVWPLSQNSDISQSQPCDGTKEGRNKSVSSIAVEEDKAGVLPILLNVLVEERERGKEEEDGFDVRNECPSQLAEYECLISPAVGWLLRYWGGGPSSQT